MYISLWLRAWRVPLNPLDESEPAAWLRAADRLCDSIVRESRTAGDRQSVLSRQRLDAVHRARQRGRAQFRTHVDPIGDGDALSTADKARAPHDRDALIKGFMEAKTPPSHEEIVARNREVTAAR